MLEYIYFDLLKLFMMVIRVNDQKVMQEEKEWFFLSNSFLKKFENYHIEVAWHTDRLWFLAAMTLSVEPASAT